VSNTSADVETTFTYDRAGNLTSTTDARGVTYTYYDALGRIKAVAAPRRTDAISPTNATIPLTVFRLDAYGNVVQRVDYANSAASVSVDSYQLPTNLSSDDRTTSTRYDSHGHAIETIDAEGHSKFTSYDVHGAVAKEWESVVGATGLTSQIVRNYRYDKNGRLLTLTEHMEVARPRSARRPDTTASARW
jgi:YD repeat-containing protein